MRIITLILTIVIAAAASADDLPEKYAPLGRLIVTNFATAPFPHPLRADGHKYHDEVYGPEHYHDSHVAVFLPKNYQPGAEVDFVVHFHGWRQHLTNVLSHYQLIEQFAGSGCKAVLIVPQGPLDSPDSFGGKLEDPGGFQRFITEAMNVLASDGVISGAAKPGRIILSGHSGGYEVISAILGQGGLHEHIAEVWLFDALYAHTERFVLWFDHRPQSRFIDLYTEHGGTKEETEALMTALKENQVPYFSAPETNTIPADLRANHLIFLYSELPHDEVMQRRHTFQRFLETSCLSR